jgi:hypothetical protein
MPEIHRVIAANEATKQSGASFSAALDYFASFSMTNVRSGLPHGMAAASCRLAIIDWRSR